MRSLVVLPQAHQQWICRSSRCSALFRSELPYSVRTALHFKMHLHFLPLLNAAAELGPILLFSEGFAAFDGRNISCGCLRDVAQRWRALPHLTVRSFNASQRGSRISLRPCCIRYDRTVGS